MNRASRHWRNQRLTSLALVPLSLWFAAGLLSLPDATHASVIRWLSQPASAVLAAMFTGCALWHSMQGVQVVVEDYVGGRLQRPTLLALWILHWVAGIGAATAIVRIFGMGVP